MSAKHVAVVMGGWSSERQVSLWSGEQCADALTELGYRVSRVDMTRQIATVLEELAPDVVFNALHGVPGEDGTLQGVLEILRIPYTHSGVLASSLAMDKQMAKRILKTAGVPVAEGRIVHRLEAAKAHVMKPPYVIKPNSGGSSVGVFIVGASMAHPPQELWAPDWSHGDTVLVERFIPGMELTCAVMGDVALGVIEIVQNNKFYDFDAKYSEGGSSHILPARIKPNIYQDIQKLSLKAHQALGCRGVSRMDFRYDDTLHGTGEIICLEVNTQPGMTRLSLIPDLARHAGHSFNELVKWIVEDASCDR